MAQTTIAALFAEASKFLREEFEYVRKTNPHPSGKGTEAEQILSKFLSNHLPKRFGCCSGLVIDDENNVSLQQDIIVYDVLSSPVYRASPTTQIVPANCVAAVVEVKSRLNKDTLEDGFAKIESCKRLARSPLSETDERATSLDIVTARSFGAIFAFASDISLETAADHVLERLKRTPSDYWPDCVVVLDEGLLGFGMAWPGDPEIPGTFMLGTEDFEPPPIFVHLMLHRDNEYTLNRFFTLLSSHLAFFPRRFAMQGFKAMLEGTAKQALVIDAFQFGLNRKLQYVTEEMRANKRFLQMTIVHKKNDKQLIGVMQWFKWQDGAVLRWYGPVPLHSILSKLLVLKPGEKPPNILGPSEKPYRLTAVLDLPEEVFRTWPGIVNAKTPYKALPIIEREGGQPPSEAHAASR